MTSIRKAASDDAATLAAIGAATFTETFGRLYKENDLSSFIADNHSVETYRELLSDDSWRLWLAESDDGAVVGYAAAGPCGLPVPDMPENSGELARLYLLGAHQGGGLGGQMLTRALDYLMARFDRIYISVYAENFGAQRLYQRAGFVKILDYRYMVGTHSDPEWIMERRR